MEPIDNTTAEADYSDNRHVPSMPLDTSRSIDDAADDSVIMHDLDAHDVHEDGSTPEELGGTLAAGIVPPAGWHPSSYS